MACEMNKLDGRRCGNEATNGKHCQHHAEIWSEMRESLLLAWRSGPGICCRSNPVSIAGLTDCDCDPCRLVKVALGGRDAAKAELQRLTDIDNSRSTRR